MGFKQCNTDGRNFWTVKETMLKNKPHLVKFHEDILVNQELFNWHSYIVIWGSHQLRNVLSQVIKHCSGSGEVGYNRKSVIFDFFFFLFIGICYILCCESSMYIYYIKSIIFLIRNLIVCCLVLVGQKIDDKSGG